MLFRFKACAVFAHIYERIYILIQQTQERGIAECHTHVCTGILVLASH